MSKMSKDQSENNIRVLENIARTVAEEFKPMPEGTHNSDNATAAIFIGSTRSYREEDKANVNFKGAIFGSPVSIGRVLFNAAINNPMFRQMMEMTLVRLDEFENRAGLSELSSSDKPDTEFTDNLLKNLFDGKDDDEIKRMTEDN